MSKPNKTSNWAQHLWLIVALHCQVIYLRKLLDRVLSCECCSGHQQMIISVDWALRLWLCELVVCSAANDKSIAFC